jgi:hypothetical protein
MEDENIQKQIIFAPAAAKDVGDLKEPEDAY